MSRYMMATKVIHQLGDISSEIPGLCIIHSEDEQNYISNWVTGFGFINVRFPKTTTRELTEAEKKYWHGRRLILAGEDFGRVWLDI